MTKHKYPDIPNLGLDFRQVTICGTELAKTGKNELIYDVSGNYCSLSAISSPVRAGSSGIKDSSSCEFFSCQLRET